MFAFPFRSLGQASKRLSNCYGLLHHRNNALRATGSLCGLAPLRSASALARWSGLRCYRDPRDRGDGVVYQGGGARACDLGPADGHLRAYLLGCRSRSLAGCRRKETTARRVALGGPTSRRLDARLPSSLQSLPGQLRATLIWISPPESAASIWTERKARDGRADCTAPRPVAGHLVGLGVREAAGSRPRAGARPQRLGGLRPHAGISS
jgi:hypothetical protein